MSVTISGTKADNTDLQPTESRIDLNGNELILDADADTSIHVSTDDQVDFKVAGSDQFRINANGRHDMGIDTYSNGAKLTLSYTSTTEGGLRCADTVTSGTHTQIQFLRGGTHCGKIECANQASTAYVTSSDYRMKENVNYSWDATTKLKQLKPAEFTWKAEYDSNKTKVQGFLAHEVSDIVPEAVSGEKDAAEMQGIDQSKLVPLLVKTIQELEARITALES